MMKKQMEETMANTQKKEREMREQMQNTMATTKEAAQAKPVASAGKTAEEKRQARLNMQK